MYKIDIEKEFQDGRLNFDINKIYEIEDFDKRRNLLRMEIVKSFGKEAPGTVDSENNKTKYRYPIDEVAMNNQIYQILLERPAYNYKGFDFVVKVINKDENNNEKLFINNNKRTDRPSHYEIKEDIVKKYKYDKKLYFWLLEKIISIYEIENIDYDDVRKKQKQFNISNNKNDFGLNLELLLKIIEWMFIEQDIRFWNGSGRNYIYKMFVAPIIEVEIKNKNVQLVHYKKNGQNDFKTIGKCNSNFEFPQKFLYSNEKELVQYNTNEDLDKSYFEKITKRTYLMKNENGIFLRNNIKNHENIVVDLSEKNITYVLGFDNRIWFYASTEKRVIEDINGILISDEDFKNIVKLKKNALIILLNNNWKESLDEI